MNVIKTFVNDKRKLVVQGIQTEYNMIACLRILGVLAVTIGPIAQGMTVYDSTSLTRTYRRADPCSPNPCSSNMQCHVVNGKSMCRTKRSKCEEDEDCSDAEYCGISECLDVCVTGCGRNAACTFSNHSAVCSCPQGYTGDPSVFCHQMDTQAKLQLKEESASLVGQSVKEQEVMVPASALSAAEARVAKAEARAVAAEARAKAAEARAKASETRAAAVEARGLAAEARATAAEARGLAAESRAALAESRAFAAEARAIAAEARSPVMNSEVIADEDQADEDKVAKPSEGKDVEESTDI